MRTQINKNLINQSKQTKKRLAMKMNQTHIVKGVLDSISKNKTKKKKTEMKKSAISHTIKD